MLSEESMNFLGPKMGLDQLPELVPPDAPGQPPCSAAPVRVEPVAAPPAAPTIDNPSRLGPRTDLQRGLALYGLSWEEAVALGVWVVDRARDRARRGPDDLFLPNEEPEG